MDKLIESITFAVSCVGSSILIGTALVCCIFVYMWIDKNVKDNNKKLIKDTIKETKKDNE